MSYINRRFPISSASERWHGSLEDPQLQAPGIRIDIGGVEEIYSGSLSYLEFISLVKKVWEEGHPQIPILPIGMNRESFITYLDNGTITDTIGSNSTAPSADRSGLNSLEVFPAVIGYSLELKKAHAVEPKPRMRQQVMSNSVTIYGQKFQNIIGFTVMSQANLLQGSNGQSTRDDLDTAILCDQIIDAFEDFMLEYTPIFKAAGASDLVYSRRLSDSEINRDNKNIHKRTVTYMLTTEKTFAIRNERIERIKIDIRNWIAVQASQAAATPNTENIEINIVDLHLSATPDQI